MIGHATALRLEGDTAALPPGASGSWCRLRVFLPASSEWWARVTLEDAARDQIVRSVFLGPLRGKGQGAWRDTLVHVPAGAAHLTLRLFNTPAAGALVMLGVLNRWEAAARLLWQGRRRLPACLAGSPFGMIGRLRAVLGQAPARAGETPPYDVWIATCESALPTPPPAPLEVQAVILGGLGAAMAATCAALRDQSHAAARPPCIVAPAEDRASVSADWVVVLQAGDILAPHALAWFAAAAAARPDAACIVADFDRLAPDGSRRDPVFLPGADALFCRSGLAAFGACAVRRRDIEWPLPPDARALRQTLIVRAAGRVVHVPRVLTHLPASAPPVRAEPVPLLREAWFTPEVAALVPSQARSMHVPKCLRRVIEGTHYPRLRAHVLLSAPQHASARVVRRLRAVSRVEVRTVPRDRFNYAAVNNAGAAAIAREFLLLLNDDVAPVAPDWLDCMLAHMQDPRVGIVGARLLYGNGMVQHEGVIMGLADLCEHAGRLRPGSDRGPHDICMVSREVCAVTAACMLVRATLYRDLGGMDEGFAIALNDVDFCLRARQAGWRIVYCAEATLYHYESLSLGRHYTGNRAALEGLEVRRLRDRWGAVIAADPCYNPLASLEPGREWQPAFCPRASLPYPPHVTATPANHPAEDSKIPH